MNGTDLDLQERRTLGTAGFRRRRRRRRQYARRRTVALLLVILIVAGFYAVAGRFGAGTATAPSVEPTATPVADTGPLTVSDPLPFVPERYLPGPDLDGDGTSEQIAIGPATAALRQIALVTGSGRNAKMVGKPITVPDFPIMLSDLPRAKGILVLAGFLPAEGSPRTVPVGKENALEAAGGEPDFHAWRLDRTTGLTPADYYALAAPETPPSPTAIVVDKGLNVLWHYDNGQLAATYRVSTGRHLRGPQPTAANQEANFLTPEGRFEILNRFTGVAYYREGIPAGDPQNPLGTRWLGFSVVPGDKGLLWAIHGTNRPDLLGRWVSKGSILMANADIEALYEKVKVGTVLQIVNSHPAP